MIDAKELRLGNCILDNIGFVRYVNHRVLSYIVSNSDIHGYKPIPINTEVLEKCSFKKGVIQSGGYYGYSDGNIELDNNWQIVLFDGRIDDVNTKEYSPGINYLHQLQNLYFALMGEELTVKL